MARELSKRELMLNKKYFRAKKEALETGLFDIYKSDTNPELFYVLLKGIEVYKDQNHILEIYTKYGSNEKYEYPTEPPFIKFMTKIHHANVSVNGSICLDTLKDKWSPSYDFISIITTIQALLQCPNPSSPLNSIAGDLYRKCNKKTKDNIWNSDKELIFAEFINAAKKVYDKSDLSGYYHIFPTLTGNNYSEKELMSWNLQIENYLPTKKKIVEGTKRQRWRKRK